jgi:4-amino-4-deoxy-L-arabinose transferase-like glycosyltransferase
MIQEIYRRIRDYRNPILLIFLVAFLIRLIYSLYFFVKVGASNFMDDYDYISYANEILAQGIFVPDIDKIYGNGHQVGIGWPLILSGFFYVFGQNYFVIFILNCLLSAFHVVLIVLLAREIFGLRVGLISGVWAAFYMHFIKFTPTILKENIIHLFLFLCLYLFIKAIKEYNGKKQILLFSVVYAIFIHIDERYFALFPVFAISFFFLRSDSFRNNFIRVSQFISIVILLMIPWLIRNYFVYERPILLAYQTSQVTDKILGYNESEIKTGEKSLKTSYNRKYLPIYEQATKDILNGKEPDTDGFRYYKDIKMGIAEGNIPHSYSYLKNLWEEFKEFFRICRFKSGFLANGYRYMPKGASINNAIYIFQYGILLPFFVFTIGYGFVKRIAVVNFLTLLIASYASIHLFIEHSLIRYRIPIDGIIIMFGIYGFLTLLNIWKMQRTSILPNK